MSANLPFPNQTCWIGSDHPFDLHEVYISFRSPAELTLTELPRSADLLIAADSRYKLWINGRFVARGGERCYPESQAVDRLDVASYLHVGPNLIAVQVYQPGYSHFSYVHRGAAGLLATLLCDGHPLLVTDTDWRVRSDPSFDARVPRISIYGSGVEVRDMNLADEWTAPGYDDDAWNQARVVASLNMAPWPGLRERSVPLLTEREIPARLLETRRGPATGESDPHLDVLAGWPAAGPQSFERDEEDWYNPSLAGDESAYWLFDLGRNYTCQGWVEIQGAVGQESLDVSYGDKLREGELVISDPATYCRVRLTDRFRLRAGDQVAASFSLRGGRYLLFRLSDPGSSSLRLRFHVRVAEYPLTIDRRLQASDPTLDAVIVMCETTARACLQESFVDCCWRESSQWLGDALPQSLIMAAMSDDAAPRRKAITMAARGAYPDGMLPSILPGEVHAYAVLDYNFTWVELLSLDWQLSGDSAFAHSMWPTLLRMLDRFDLDLDADGLIHSEPGRRLFLDWSPLSRVEPNAVYNLRYLLALQTALTLAHETGYEPGSWRDRSAALQTAIRSTFCHDGRWYDDPQRTTFSQQAAVLAILTGCVEAAEIDALLDTVAARSLDLDDDSTPGEMVLASPFMHHYIFEALKDYGRHNQVVEIIRLRWGRWADAGFPTTWENWNVDFPDGSQCHAFSAHPRYHLADIANRTSIQL